jgi:hypothetical protein
MASKRRNEMDIDIVKELRLWARDDIVPSDLQELCKSAADVINDLEGALMDATKLFAREVEKTNFEGERNGKRPQRRMGEV